MEIINRVDASGIVTLDLEEFYPTRPRFELDIAPWLWQGLVLKERDFRDAVAAYDWEQYRGGAVAVFCSEADALIQTWAWMLVGARLAQVQAEVVIGTGDELEKELFRRALGGLELADFEGKRVVLKGCSKHAVPASAYGELAARLLPHVQSLMFGEACSAVPIYKKKRDAAPAA
jgi:Protein of unknown function (DUF2480)